MPFVGGAENVLPNSNGAAIPLGLFVARERAKLSHAASSSSHWDRREKAA